MLMFMQKQALLWCIERENPILPKSETDHPVQFWQLKKANGKVSDVPLFQFCVCSVNFYRRSTLTVRHDLCPVSPAPHLIRSCYQDTTRDATQAWQRRTVCRQHGPVCTWFFHPNLC